MRTAAIIFMFMVTIFSCKKKSEDVLTEKGVMKKVEFHVHAGHDYTAPVYQHVTADVKMSIYKINYLTGQSQLLWDTAFAERSLPAFPHLPQKYLIEKSFPILESKEKLQANFHIRYKSAEGTTLQSAVEELVPGESFSFLDVNI